MLKTASYTIVSQKEAKQQRQIILREKAREIYRTFCQKRKVGPRIITGFKFNSDESLCYLMGNNGESFARIDLIQQWITFN